MPRDYTLPEATRWAARWDAARVLHRRRVELRAALVDSPGDNVTIAGVLSDVERRIGLRRELDALEAPLLALDVVAQLVDEGSQRLAMHVLTTEVLGLRLVRCA